MDDIIYLIWFTITTGPRLKWVKGGGVESVSLRIKLLGWMRPLPLLVKFSSIVTSPRPMIDFPIMLQGLLSTVEVFLPLTSNIRLFLFVYTFVLHVVTQWRPLYVNEYTYVFVTPYFSDKRGSSLSSRRLYHSFPKHLLRYELDCTKLSCKVFLPSCPFLHIPIL